MNRWVYSRDFRFSILEWILFYISNWTSSLFIASSDGFYLYKIFYITGITTTVRIDYLLQVSLVYLGFDLVFFGRYFFANWSIFLLLSLTSSGYCLLMGVTIPISDQLNICLLASYVLVRVQSCNAVDFYWWTARSFFYLLCL